MEPHENALRMRCAAQGQKKSDPASDFVFREYASVTGTPGSDFFCDAPILEDLQNTPFSPFAAFSFFSEFWYEIHVGQ